MDAGDPLAQWLEQLGLAQYAQAFADQDVTLDLVADLTSEDLTEIGVRSIGHRRRLLTAAQAVGAVVAPVSPAPQDPKPASGAEQRMVTAMFCDLVGSTRLSTQMDPEEYRDLIARFRQVITQTLVPYDGHVARFLGDGIVVFFGLARAQDHAAENAVAAALDVINSLSGGTGAHPMQVRIGIATGMTVVEGPSPDSTQIQTDDTVVGEIPNLAARLQAVAHPNSAVISQATHDRVGHLFHCDALEGLTLKGIAEDVRAWTVTDHADSDSRFDARMGHAPATQFVGRRREMARLMATAQSAQKGHGQVSLIIGDAGMGKSRLARELLIQTGMDPARPLILQCMPYHAGTPFHPLRRTIGRLLETLPDTDGATPLRDKASRFLSSYGMTGTAEAGLLADVLATSQGLPQNERRALDNRYAQIAMLTDLFCAMATTAGTALLEDLQWMDPSTVEVLSRVADRLDGLPAHLMCTMRPGPAPDWCMQAQADVLQLDRLQAVDFAALVRSIALASAPDVSLSDAQITEIAARCDGSPVFAEELTRFALGRETGSATEAPLPATLADALLSRLDRLETGRQLAQLAAVIGTEFPVDILIAVSDLTKAEVLRGVASLIDAGVLQRAHSSFGAAVGFRHMLLRDAAYLTLLRRDRVAQHAAIATTLTRAFPTISAAMPQVVAHHLSSGGDIAHAVTFWERAGTIAAGRSAYSEAIGHFRKALADCASAPAALDMEDTELRVRLNLVAALIAAHGFNAPQVQAEMPRVEALGAALQSTDQMLPLLVSKWVFSGASGQFHASLEVARQIIQVTADGDEVDRLLALRCIGTANFFSGNLSEAKTELEGFFALYDPSLHDAGLERFGSSHHGAMSAVGLAELAVLACDDTASDRWSLRAQELADLSGQAHDLCHTTIFTGCVLPLFRGQLEVVARQADTLRKIADAHGLPVWAAYADLFKGIVLMTHGDLDAGAALADASIRQTQSAQGFLNFCMVFHAEACLNAGLTAQARDSHTRIGAAMLDQHSWLSAEFGRVEAMIAHAEGRPHAQVMAIATRALDLAQRQRAVLFDRKLAAFITTLE